MKRKPTKGTIIYVFAFEPGDGKAAIGGHEWRYEMPVVRAIMDEMLDEDPSLDHTMLLRRLTLPRDFASAEEVTSWLDGEAIALITTALEELP